MTEVCKNCGHDENQHTNGFMCYHGIDTNDIELVCRCPGWIKKVEGVNTK